MARILRLSTAIVLGVVGLVILGFAIYVLAMADAGATERELRSWGPVHRALFVMAHGRYMTAVAGALIVVALAVLGLVVGIVVTDRRAKSRARARERHVVHDHAPLP